MTKPKDAKDQEFSLVEIAQIEAMDEVLAYRLWDDKDPKKKVRPISWDYFVRRLYRWYAKTLGGSMSDDIGTVFQHYFESRYEEMEEVELLEEAAILAETLEERSIRLAKEREDAEADDEFLKQVQEEAQKAAATLKQATQSVQTMGQLVDQLASTVAAQIPPDLPDIKLEVVSDEEIAKMEEENWRLFGGGADPDKL